VGVGPDGGAGSPVGVGAPREATLTKATGAEAMGPAQAGDAAGQLASMLPSALGAIGGLAGGAAGMLGQIPQALMQSGQGMAQAATQGLSGLMSQKSPDGKLPDGVAVAGSGGGLPAGGGGSAGGGGAGDTVPAGALGEPVIPSTSHTPPTVPSGAPTPPAPTPAGGTAMGGMPMGMPMGGMMPHGGAAADGSDRQVAADKKLVVPPQAHTEPVTGKVSDRTAAAAEAARARAEAEDADEQPSPGRVLRRITLAPLHGDGS
jgi:hypothetical protein